MCRCVLVIVFFFDLLFGVYLLIVLFFSLNMAIPVVDFSVYELDKTNVSDDKFKKLSQELKDAFIEIGFVYLKNTGIHQEEVCRF